jgi:hypothetical protein
MSNLVPANMGGVAAVFANVNPDAGDLSSGIQGGFGHIGYKGKVWSVRFRGEEVQLMRPDGDGPRNSIELVILKSSPAVSKIFYKDGYVEGSNSAPDCWSTDGIKPSAGAAMKQAVTCATCPKNAWGSRITPEGKQAKACSDSRRLAVVPLNDIKNEVYGGPMLLRVPAASLQDLAQFGQKMGHLGYPYYAIGVRVSFDPASAFPKFQFAAIRALTNDEALLVVEMQKSAEVARILAENDFAAQPALPAPHQQALAAAFEQPPMQLAAPLAAPPPAAAPAPAPVTQQVTSGFGTVSAPTKVQPPAENNVVPLQQPAPAAPVAAAPAAQPAPAPAPAAGASDFEAALDAKLGELLPPVS